MKAETAAKPKTLSANVTPGPRASREMKGPRPASSVGSYCSGSREAMTAPSSGAPAANAQIVGTVGYCMSGRYAVNAATHFPDRVKAAASVYGTHLATDQPDSPHLAASKTKAELYFACAETDIYAPQEIIDKVAAGMKGSNNEVEIYPGTHHGFAFPKRPVYHRDAAERHWERLLALYRRNLVP